MNNLKKVIYTNKILSKVVIPVYLTAKRTRNFSSQNYWEKRYRRGGNSGAGSYGQLAQFKADELNKFAKKHGIKTVLEMGCGDGNQLKLFKFHHYIGLDVSMTSIKRCVELFSTDKDKSFFLYNPECFVDNQHIFSADMTMSLDVIYHLVEDDIFEKYMRDLFAMSKNYVIIYSSDLEDHALSRAQHVRHRRFTKWVEENIEGWELEGRIKNKHGLKSNQIEESFADFYIYKKAKR